jgi:arylsulfatase
MQDSVYKKRVEPKRLAEDAPNILIILMDDVGPGTPSTYGGEINTPTLSRVAKAGVSYNRFHSTAMCSPTRAALLTGRNHTRVGNGQIAALANDFDGFSGTIPKSSATVAEVLKCYGYNTGAWGKWHNTPEEHITTKGPFEFWPTGYGFEYFYGFLAGEASQYEPTLTRNTSAVVMHPKKGYHLSEDIAEDAINWLREQKAYAPDKPFFMYFCPGAAHAPHHVPKEWADPYKGKFDDGWDAYRERTFARQKELGIIPQDAELSRHDPDVQDWNALSADEKKLYARMMEVFAGFLSHTDYHYGRLFEFLKSIGEWDNTIIMFISDNGASSEGGPSGSVNENKFFNNVPDSLKQNLEMIDELGGPTTFNHYAWGWTFAGNTPFRRWKRETYRGGISDPFIVHWPKGIQAKGEVRTQYAHAIDMVPTVLEALGLEAPISIKGVTQSPIEGHSFAHALNDGKAPSKHITQYFEMMGHRSIYHDGWRAVCPWPGTSFKEAGMFFGAPIDKDKLTELDAKGWELYHIEQACAEKHNLAAENRAKLIEMIATWYVEAGKYNVLPVDSRGTLRFADPRPQIAGARTSYTVYPGTQMVPVNAGPQFLNRPHSITAEVDIPKGGAEGALLSAGDVQGGFCFYVQGGKLHYVYNYVGSNFYHVESGAPLPEGRHKLRFEFEVTGKPDIKSGKGAPGRGQLYVDGKLVGQGDIPLTMPLSIGLAGGIVCGADSGSPVWDKYKPPFKFTGTLYSVTVDVSGELIKDDEQALKAIMARQ